MTLAKLSSVTVNRAKDDGYSNAVILRQLVNALSDAELDILLRFAKRGPLTYVGQGGDRIVFVLPGGHTVLKVDKNRGGWGQNKIEHKAYLARKAQNKPIAACRPISPNMLLMRAVTPVGISSTGEVDGAAMAEAWAASGYKPTHDWTQVGHNKAGKLVVYDAGIEPA